MHLLSYLLAVRSKLKCERRLQLADWKGTCLPTQLAERPPAVCQAPWQGLWVQKVADKRPALEEATGKDEAAVMTSRRGVRVPARSHGLQERRGVAEYVGGGWEAFSEEAALQKSFHPGRERALHRGSDTQKAQTGSPGRAEGPAGGRASPASGAEGGAVGDEAAEAGRTLYVWPKIRDFVV